MNVRNLSSLFLSLFTLVVLGCGGGGGGGGTAVIPADPNAPTALTVSSSAPSRLVSDPPVTITANVLKSNGSPVAIGTVVNFTTTGGTLSAVTTTNASGNATATLTSPSKGTFTVTVTVGSLPAKTAQVACIDPNAPNAVTVTGANTANIGTGVVLTATVTPDGSNGTGGPGGAIPDGTVVTFSSLTPGAAFSAVTTTVGGVATATLSGIATPATVTVTASAGGILSPAKTINFIDPNVPSIVTVTGTPVAGFINGQRPVVVSANVVRVVGGPVPTGTTVNFVITAGTGSLTSATATTNASGDASVTLNSTVEGNVTVQATAAPANSSAIFAFSNPNKPASIALAANPVSGVINNQTPVTLTATLTPVDVANGTIANGTTVNFAIISGTGTLSVASATTTGGVASVTLNSTAAGTIAVNATAGSAPVVTSSTVNVGFVTQPTTVTVKLATSGTLPLGTLIGGIQAVATASPSTGLSIQPSDVILSGVSANSLLTPNTTTVSSVQLALINTTGFGIGEFVTLTYHVASGTFPVAGSFGVTPVSVINTIGAVIPGITVAVQSVTIQ
jgi:hypothetical protein